MFDSMDGQGELSSSPTSHPGLFDDFNPCESTPFDGAYSESLVNQLTVWTDSDRYVSFPSFDMYEVDQQEGKESDMKAP